MLRHLNINISISDCLKLYYKFFGVSDWRVYLHDFPRFTASFFVDNTSNLAISLFPWRLNSHEVISAVASSRLLCTLSHADLTGALRNYGVFPEGTLVPWYRAVESLPRTPSRPSPLSFRPRTDVNGRFSTLLVFLPSPERQGNNGRADARLSPRIRAERRVYNAVSGILTLTSLPRHHYYHPMRVLHFFSLRHTLLVRARARMRQSDEAANVKNCTGTRDVDTPRIFTPGGFFFSSCSRKERHFFISPSLSVFFSCAPSMLLPYASFV